MRYLVLCPQVVPLLGDLVGGQLPLQTQTLQDGAEGEGGEAGELGGRLTHTCGGGVKGQSQVHTSMRSWLSSSSQ